MSIDIVGAVSKVYDVVGPTLLRQCGYAVFCNNYVSDLKGEIKKLKDASIRLQHRVDRAESVKEIIEDDVLTWLSKADQLIVSGNLILQENNVSCFGFVPNPKARYVLGRRAKKCLPTLKEHLNEGKFDEVSFHPVAEPIVEVKVRSATSSSTVCYVELKSRALVLKKIVAALDDHKKIGVYGMGGVGKTALLKEVEKIVKESGKFDDVVGAFVSQTPDIEGIKSKICNKLKWLESNGDDTSKKTLLILLDDLWEEFKGIEVLEKDTKVKVKWVMTSRKQALLAKEMFCHPTFSLGVLDEEEGWHLFRELVMSKNNVEGLMKNPTTVELLKKCAGLPVSIEALATIWKNKGLSPTDLISVEELKHDNDLEDGSVSLELSYSYLRDQDGKEEAKLLFKTIGLLGTPIVPILTLLKYTVGLDLFGSSTNDKIMERARREVIRSVCTLQDSSLLLESDDNNHVKIHDLVRDVAVRIASRDDHALIFNPEDSVKGWSREKMKDSTAVSLPYSALPMLLYTGGECPNANIFIMRVSSEQGDWVKLPDFFFKGMVKLKIIDLRNARFTSLPSSIQSDVHNLTTLCLDYCYLEDVAAIGNLKSLQVLSFVGSHIAELPEEIGGLINLRMLDLSKCLKLKSIKPGVLGRLTRLEELYLKESFNEWEIKGNKQQQSNSSLGELNNMVLSILELHVCDDSKLPSSLPLGDLVQYKVLIGDVWDWSGEYKEARTLKLKVQVKWHNIMTEEWLQSALQKIQDFHLDGLSGNKESFHEVCWEGFKELKHLHLQNCSSIKSIVWSMEWSSCVAFTTLESMYLENLERLEKICNGLISLASFSKLKVVRVQECHKLRNLFNTSFVKSLPELEEIEVSDCSLIREILIAEKMDEDDKKVMACCSDNLLCYPIKRSSEVSKTQSDAEESSCEDYEFKLDNLHSLTLRNLSELTTFFSKETPSSDSTNIPLPAFFNDQQVSLHNNDRQKLFSCSKFKEIQSSAHLALSLGTLRRVVVEDCNKIVNFIDSRMLLKLGNLESLSIARCESLKDIFDLEGIDAESGNNKILPKLLELKLKGLPKLEHIWKKNFKQIKGCRNLRIFEIYQCDKLSYLCGSSMGKGMENLTEIEIEKCGKMETIFLDEDVSTKDVSTLIRLTSLKSLAISKCQNLKTFLSTDYSKACKCSDNGMSCWCCGKQDSILGDRSISFFSDKVSLPSLESLFLSSSGKFETLCCINLPTDRSYYNLEVVNVEWCGTLSVVFPATLIDRLQKLKQLLVRDCLKLRTIVNLDVDWKDKKRPKALMLSQLQELTLSNLVDMTHVMEPGDSDIVVAFPNLKQLTVEKCSKLMYLIPISTATTLLKLESLDISYCKELREVIDGEVSDGYKRNVINFPHLTDLCMSGLESLTHFSSESYFFDFTCLKRIHINSCQNLKTLVKPTSSVHDSGSQATTGVQALFDNKVELPNLEKLDIKSIEVEELWCSEPQTTSFCKLKSLKVDGCSKLKYLIPTSTATTLLKLESLDIHSCKELQEVIHGEVSDGYKRNVINFPHLTDLCMSGLESLTHFSSESYLFDFPCLQRIQIDKCENLEALLKPTSSGHDLGSQATTGVQALFNNKVDLPNLEELEIGYTKVEELWCNEPLTTSFCKLKTLRVSNCGQLRNIIPSFIVKRLQTLEGMDIRECTLLDDIFKIPSKEQITSVHDSRVPEGCILEENKHSLDKIILPKLTSLRVGNNIKLSSLQLGRYTLELPSLKELSVFQTARDTVEAIFEKAYLPNLEELKVEFTRITELWHNEPHVGSFCKLRHLQVDGCGQLTRIIPSFMLKRMKNLETLEVFNCNQLQTVAELGVLIEPQGSESKLPNSPFENLISIQVEYCECLISLFTISKRPDEIGDTSQCRDTIVLPHLTKLRLERLPNLRHLFEVPEGQYSLELSSLKEFFLISYGEKEAITQKVIFPKDLQIRDHDTFFGSTTSVAMDIRNALHKTRKNKNIIGALGRMDDYVIKELVRIVKEEEKMFDEVLDCRWESTVRIQEEIGRVLGIVYGAAGEEEIAQRLRKALLSNRNKRLLLITIDMWVTSDEIKAIGVPFEEVDPKMFKLIVMSMEKEALIKMGDQLPIQIGCKVGERLSIFTRELLFFAGELAYSKMVQLQQQELQVDSNTDNQISSFVGSNTAVMSHIINALLNTNIQIIGLFGKEGIKDYRRMFMELARIVKEEVNLMFDDIVDLDGNNIDERNFWEQFRDDTGVGLPERTQLNNLGERLLKNKEKRLLLLIWRDLDHELDLHQLIGIPREGLDPKLLKIILYSKNKEALHKMGAGQVIDVTSISSVYPCYYRILDRYVEKSDLRKLADECGCDYLAELLAKKLKGKGLHAWGNAFQRLKESPFEYEARRRVITSL